MNSKKGNSKQGNSSSKQWSSSKQGSVKQVVNGKRVSFSEEKRTSPGSSRSSNSSGSGARDKQGQTTRDIFGRGYVTKIVPSPPRQPEPRQRKINPPAAPIYNAIVYRVGKFEFLQHVPPHMGTTYYVPRKSALKFTAPRMPTRPQSLMPSGPAAAARQRAIDMAARAAAVIELE